MKKIVGGSGGSCTNVHPSYITALTAFQAWQLQYFGCTNNGSLCPQAAADADPYGIGMSNTNQFLTGLHPTNAASVFRIVSVAPPNSVDVSITWTAAGVRTSEQ